MTTFQLSRKVALMSVLEESTFAKFLEAASLCRERALDVPMLVLVYTAMDALAWALYGERFQGVRERFTALCENYILPGSGIRCNALELYSARCSVVHTFGWESDLSKSGKARSAFYSFGTDDPTLAQAALELTAPGKFICLNADDLLFAVRGAVAAIHTLASKDGQIAGRLSIAAGKQYRSLESANGDRMFEAFIQKTKNE